MSYYYHYTIAPPQKKNNFSWWPSVKIPTSWRRSATVFCGWLTFLPHRGRVNGCGMVFGLESWRVGHWMSLQVFGWQVFKMFRSFQWLETVKQLQWESCFLIVFFVICKDQSIGPRYNWLNFGHFWRQNGTEEKGAGEPSLFDQFLAELLSEQDRVWWETGVIWMLGFCPTPPQKKDSGDNMGVSQKRNFETQWFQLL